MIYIQTTDVKDFYKMQVCLLPGYALHLCCANYIQQLKYSLDFALAIAIWKAEKVKHGNEMYSNKTHGRKQ